MIQVFTMRAKFKENFDMYTTSEEQSVAINVEEYAYLVKRIAHHIMARMPSSVQVDDLIQSGMIGLLEAVQKYDASKGASFETYAGIRIRGAIVDEMRRGDWAPRSVHRNNRRINEAISAIESRSGRDARDEEVAAYLGVDIEEYHAMTKDCASSRLFSLEESLESDNGYVESQVEDQQAIEPGRQVSEAAMRSALAAEIRRLPEREKLVLSLYYEQDLNLKEIGEVLNVSESRVSQIHSQAAARLRSRLKDWRY